MVHLVKFRALRFIGILFAAAIFAGFYLKATVSRADDSTFGDDASADNSLSPAGELVIDVATGLPGVAPLTRNFVRTPDATGPDGKGRYLIAVNSGYGVEFNSKSKPQQTLSVIDLNLKPDPQVIQTVYFPAPQCASVGLSFDPRVKPDGKYQLYVSGGFENKIWIL